jgi:arylsulfatase A-like enzyme
MNRRSFLSILGASCLASGALFCRKQPKKPNIVFIVIDDMGWRDLGCYGSEYYETPNIDHLAETGVKFTNAYANAPNCAPSRACLMSGQYTPRHGVYTVNDPVRGDLRDRKVIPPDNSRVLLKEKVIIAELLKQAGYRTASMGKWHLGDPPELGPKAQGFDVNIGGDINGHPPAGYFSPYKLPNLENAPQGEYLTDRLSEEAVKFIRNNQNNPFFLYLPHYAVHTPIQAKEKMIEKYRQKQPSHGHNNPEYAAMIESVDSGVGRIMQTLKDLKIHEQTIVMIMSDNGGVGGYQALGIPNPDITSNAPLKGGKGMLYEGGIRVPMIVSWPGTIKSGREIDEPVIGLDLYPTLLTMTGAAAQAGYTLDGMDLVPLLKGNGQIDRKAIFWHFPAYLQAREGALRTSPAGVVRMAKWKLIKFFEDDHLELYNLETDIGETNNLVDAEPDKTKELHTLLLDWQKELNAPIPKPNPDYRWR